MTPIVTIIGRPNVGKSTLFNVLTASRAALVADMPGVTRDRQYGEAQFGDRSCLIVDTGGIAEPDDEAMAALTEQQVRQAISESTCILFMVDAQAGLTAADEMIAHSLRDVAGKVMLVVNKADHEQAEVAAAEFHQLGFKMIYVIAAIRKRGIKDLIKALSVALPLKELMADIVEQRDSIHIAVVGRPNVGKSTLINRILGEERVVVYDRPGTTRDSIYIPFQRREQNYTLIDTAGVRRRSKVTQTIEKFSILQTMQAIKSAQVVIIVFDAREAITEQDMRLLGLIVQFGKGLVIAINKWDGLDDSQREQIRQQLERKLPFVDFARRYFISALHGTGVGKLFYAIDEAFAAASIQPSTAELTRLLQQAVADHQPPLVRGRRIKLRYAHLGGHDPLVIVVHGKQTESLPQSYQRYLANYFREALQIIGIPLLIRMKNDQNPYIN